MGEKNARIERHAERYEARGKQLHRLLLTTVVVALVVDWKVLTPLHAIAQSVQTLRAEQVGAGQELADAKRVQESYAAARPLLDAIDQTLKQDRPWRQRNEALQKELAALAKDRDRLERAVGGGRAGRIAEVLRIEEKERRSITHQGERAPDPLAASVSSEEKADASAVRRFGLEAALLAPDPDPAVLRSTLESRVGAEATRVTDEAIDEIVGGVDLGVRVPLRMVLAKLPAGDVDGAAILAAAEELNGSLARWKEERTRDHSWAMTVGTKNETMERFGSELGTWSRKLDQAWTQATSAVRTRIQQADERCTGLDRRLAEHQARTVELAQAVDELLPDWLQGFLTPPELELLFPFLLLASGLAVGVVALLVRQHFIVVRGELYGLELARSDPALSSCWTLVWRGRAGTLVTLATFLVGALVWCWVVWRCSGRLLARGDGLAGGEGATGSDLFAFADTREWHGLLAATQTVAFVGTLAWMATAAWLVWRDRPRAAA